MVVEERREKRRELHSNVRPIKLQNEGEMPLIICRVGTAATKKGGKGRLKGEKEGISA